MDIATRYELETESLHDYLYREEEESDAPCCDNCGYSNVLFNEWIAPHGTDPDARVCSLACAEEWCEDHIEGFDSDKDLDEQFSDLVNFAFEKKQANSQ